MHNPVLVDEVLENLHIVKNKLYVDATLGAGGHAVEIVRLGGKVLGIDADPEMLKIAEDNLSLACPPLTEESEGRYKLVQGNFRNLADIINKNTSEEPAGILMDLGVSSFHYDAFERGFSFQRGEAELDMRLDPKSQAVKASDLLNVLSISQLRQLFETVMSKSESINLAKKVDEARKSKRFETVGDVLRLFGERDKRKTHPATKMFLALRIAVNDELGAIQEGIVGVFGSLGKGGRLLVITFHSKEDALVKEIFRNLEEKAIGRIVTRHAIVPGQDEVTKNPRARSAQLRVIEKR